MRRCTLDRGCRLRRGGAGGEAGSGKSAGDFSSSFFCSSSCSSLSSFFFSPFSSFSPSFSFTSLSSSSALSSIDLLPVSSDLSSFTSSLLSFSSSLPSSAFTSALSRCCPRPIPLDPAAKTSTTRTVCGVGVPRNTDCACTISANSLWSVSASPSTSEPELIMLMGELRAGDGGIVTSSLSVLVL